MTRRMLVAGCADWALTAAGVTPDVPAAVMRNHRVWATTAAARAAGVQRGQRQREAQAQCPELDLLDGNPAAVARAFEPVVAAVTAFSPRVEIVRPGVVALATRGPSHYFGGDAALTRKIAEAVLDVLTRIAPGISARTAVVWAWPTGCFPRCWRPPGGSWSHRATAPRSSRHSPSRCSIVPS